MLLTSVRSSKRLHQAPRVPQLQRRPSELDLSAKSGGNWRFCCSCRGNLSSIKSSLLTLQRETQPNAKRPDQMARGRFHLLLLTANGDGSYLS